ncbi:uncharacterized protein LOC126842233 [Adelges cooleyi]|uniref:uncharacterized protein LOC126842233 n=2 Tax=Adelges cooleyi TaxID=133065 RepID=UPI00217F9527|nr:uncharacterized protein LOC126841599 isoform X1 [Adelges cooleyi]XP_050434142.1 uncharacterized protein LOC126841599 isoform X2 [Adelges cooleyi]XP_050434143.1 uncharacterized protein LOC126841599 isoform X3 [Adelges cooleyi]XP_050435080.1 uncharacterized protein LOC126842233 [Adelges cooleyi]
MSVDPFRFDKNDIVLCYHRSMLYEAKCLKRRIGPDGELNYYIHYIGWKTKWDEWVHDDRVLSVNEFSLDHMKALQDQHKFKKHFNKGRVGRRKKNTEVNQTTDAPSSATEESEPSSNPVLVAFRTVGLIENNINNLPAIQEFLPPYDKQLKFDVPTILKRRLSYDYNMINVFNKQLKFPSKFTVMHLIDGYIGSKQKSTIFVRERALCVGSTFIQYFNSRIQTLLYAKERNNEVHNKAVALLSEKIRLDSLQFKYKNIYSEDLWCTVYGPIYLLRLCVNLKKFLRPKFVTEDNQLSSIADSINDFFKYLEQQHSKYFANDDYEPATDTSETEVSLT